MITPQELRLGITLYDSLRKVEVTITKKHLREFLIDEKTFFERYKAILISEEILLECGFEKAKNNTTYADGDFVLNKNLIVRINGINDQCFFYILENNYLNNYYVSIKDFDFIHQLENLIFDLTQESLIKK